VKALVIGGSGRLGQEIVRILAQKKYQVDMTSSVTSQGFVTLDLRNRLTYSDVNNFVANTDLIIYSAADNNNYPTNSLSFLQQININALNALTFAEVCTNSLKTFVYISGAIVYEHHFDFVNREDSPFAKQAQSSYQISKVLAEKLLEEISLKSDNLAIVRPPSIYGGDPVRMGLIESKCLEALNTGKIKLFQPEMDSFNFIHASDLAGFISLIIDEKIQGTFNVSNLNSFTVLQIVETISKISGVALERVVEPIVPAATQKYVMDLSKMRNTGWSPKIDLLDGISLILGQLRQRI
jgi:GDP-L-fucose synthase